MKHKNQVGPLLFFALILTTLLYSCSRYYSAKIENNTDKEAQIITYGDSLTIRNNQSSISLISVVNNNYLYTIQANSKETFLESTNSEITADHIAFNAMHIIIDTDSTYLESPEAIMSHMERCKTIWSLHID